MMTKIKIQEWLKNIEKDERLHYPPADIRINAFLALQQVTMETTSNVLRKILDMPLCNHDKKSGRWVEIK